MYTRVHALKYRDRNLVCSPSKFKPDELLLRTLRKDAKDKRNQVHLKTSAGGFAEKVERKFEYASVQCGLWDYQTSDLVFVTQVVAKRKGSIMFGKKNMALMAHSDGIRVPDLPTRYSLFQRPVHYYRKLPRPFAYHYPV